MDSQRANALELLIRRLELHSRLRDTDRQAIRSLPGQIRSVRSRSDFVQVGRHVEHACLVASGVVGRFVQLEDGSRMIVSIHIPGDLVDLYSLMLPQAPTALTAISPVEVMQIPHNPLRDLVAAHPSLATVFWRDTVIDGSMATQATVNVGRRDARSRIAHLVCEMAVRFSRVGAVHSGQFTFPVTQEQLGDVLALTPVHVNRTLRALREEGVLRLASGKIHIMDWPALKGAAGFDPGYLCMLDQPRPLSRVA